MKLKILEKDIQRGMIDWLLLKGFKVWRQNSGAMSGTYKGKSRFVRFTSQPGLSDIIGWIPPKLCGHPISRFFAVEVKRPGGVVSQDQQTFIDGVNRDGGVGIIAHSLEELIESLQLQGVQVS